VPLGELGADLQARLIELAPQRTKRKWKKGLQKEGVANNNPLSISLENVGARLMESIEVEFQLFWVRSFKV
jgi:hypothetical protein